MNIKQLALHALDTKPKKTPHDYTKTTSLLIAVHHREDLAKAEAEIKRRYVPQSTEE